MHHHDDSSEKACVISQSQIQTKQHKGKTDLHKHLFPCYFDHVSLSCLTKVVAAFLGASAAHLLWRDGLSHKLVLQQIESRSQLQAHLCKVKVSYSAIRVF